MEKISSQQAAEMMKTAASTLRALSEDNSKLRTENEELVEKVASYEKKARAEAIAAKMEEKGLNTDLSLQEKVAQIMNRDDLDVLEQAVGMSAPQMKLASVHDDEVEVEEEGNGDEVSDTAAQAFARNLASLS